MATQQTEKLEIRNRWTNRVQFTAEVTCAPDATIGVKIGLAVRWARRNDADLSGAVLRGAVLRGADLRGADLSGAPIIPDIHRRVYEAASQPGALDMGDWHTCDTTHCRAGWVVALAGEEGQKLEDEIGTAGAATLIYLASDPKLDRFPNFYTNNAEALADMKRLAEQAA
jgi:hypothetical protein